MNSVYLLIAGLGVFALGYRFYSAFIAAKVLSFDETRRTPAYAKSDGRDFVPTNRFVLFGHHFAAIAGAGPLIGPVLAAQFGFLPGAVWIIFGAVFAGAVHDIVILFASVRNGGEVLHNIARRYMGRLSGITTALATLFIIITALAGLAIAVVNSMNESSWGTFTIGFTIPVALLVGWYMKGLRPDKIAEASVIGVVLVLGGVILGRVIQQSSASSWFMFSRHQLSIMLAVYGFAASVLPVWLLLAPRDYLSTYMKLGTIALLALGIVIAHPYLQMPALTSFVHGGGPIIPGKVWPYVFITIACGAISGFHALISSGTTPKMLKNEKDIRFIGYGAMITEGFVALMALIAASVLPPGDYFAINTMPAVFARLGMGTVHMNELSKLVGEHITGRPGGAVSLAVGMAYIFGNIPGLKTLMSYWYHFAIMFEALFILTTIDAGTRVGRYILQESIGSFVPRLKEVSWWPGVILTSAVISISWGYLLYFGSIGTIWPMFGVANQLLAVIALTIGTTYLLNHSPKKAYGLITFIPFVFMLAVTFTAGVENIFDIYLPQATTTAQVNIFLTTAMLVLVMLISADGIRNWFNILSGRSLPVAEGATDDRMPEDVRRSIDNLE
ncbi:MAG: carbon starvation protein A [Deltaproteobacteria bacterium]|nr:carbon starvation protein A [Deltaproteobacteria bacterium]MCL5276331.1 carbon starvation protein A [Deltaproteobacteria bacterium]